ncbi:MAG TPA: prepilin-type N-terminal cleavage/methylation domain-containing protein [Candidatus Polarisedimenticolaceae bacterium]|nr:prepilin-type N-terminal cleavage/methylation domain-containing protein [Candidatus Polarisedimenticolaceae bacterium]
MNMHRTSSGFTLPEVLVALFLLAIGILAAAPMFVFAMEENRAGAVFGEAGALAVERLELLRGQSWSALTPGGSLTSDVTGYSDTSNPVYDIRWQITNRVSPVGTRDITVWVRSPKVGPGVKREVTLTTVRGR